MFARLSLLALLLAAAPLLAKDDDTPVEYGPAICHSVTFVKPDNHNAPTWPGALTRAIVADLPGDSVICYDAERLSVAAVWQGGLLDFTKTHHTSYKGNSPPRPAVEPIYRELDQAGWANADGPLGSDKAKLLGYYLHEDSVVLSLDIAGRKIVEEPGKIGNAFRRSFHVAAGDQQVSALVAKVDGRVTIRGNRCMVAAGERSFAAMLGTGADRRLPEGLAFRIAGGRVYVDLPASPKAFLFDVWFVMGAEKVALDLFEESADLGSSISPITKTEGGPRRWTKPMTTAGKLAKDDAAYVVDDLGVPENPYGRYMRLSAIDFFDDGRIAVATLPGDVWIVSWEKDDLTEVRWQRFATGMYEPLGMKIVDGKIYVRGRDRITRLHDLNDDGEADYYENFHWHGPVGPGYHAFVFDLVTDKAGNFYFSTSGRKAPTKGQVVKLSPDGKTRETVATWFRHPNGMGAGGPHDWVTIGDNPDGKYPSGASIVRGGQSYGEMGGPRTQPMLYVLPPKVDTSSASQCWADPERWGPLSGAMVHTSYSTSTLTYVVAKDSKPHASGYAVHMPFAFKSGVMRLRPSPIDGQLYIAGQRGWDSNAANDGCLHRIRYTGKPAYLVTDAKATPDGVQLTFSCKLDPATVDFDNFYAARVGGKGEKEIDIEDVERVDDHTVLVLIDDIDPGEIVDERATKKLTDGRTAYRVVDPLAITFNMKAADGTAVKDTVYCTINGY